MKSAFIVIFTGQVLACNFIDAFVFFNNQAYLTQQRQAAQTAQSYPSSQQAYYPSPPGSNPPRETKASYSSVSSAAASSSASSTPSCQSVSLDYPPGTRISVVCPVGYELVGMDSSKCVSRGYWSEGGIGFCRKLSASSLRKCETPETPENGYVADRKVHDDGYYSGDFVQYNCHEGYRMSKGDTGRLLCHPSGYWSDELPQCNEIPDPKLSVPIVVKSEKRPVVTSRCVEPKTPENSHILGLQSEAQSEPGKEYEPDDFIRYSCDDGFVLEDGSDVISCQPNGTWTGGMPQCKMVVENPNLEQRSEEEMEEEAPPTCEQPKSPEQAFIIEQSRPDSSGNRFAIGSFLTYDCAFGYNMVGSETIYCIIGGKWNEQPPKCVQRAVRKMWTVHLCRQDSDGDGVTNGEELGDPDCTWNPASSKPPSITAPHLLSHPGICEPLDSQRCAGKNGFLLSQCPDKLLLTKRCTPPTPPKFSRVIQSTSRDLRTYSIGDFFEVKCQEGYKIQGKPRVYCLQNGTWTNQPICTPAVKIFKTPTCPPPKTMPTNSFVSSSPSAMRNGRYMVGSLFQYQCNDGYRQTGYSNTACLQNGQWSILTLTCTFVKEIIVDGISSRKVYYSAPLSSRYNFGFPSAAQQLPVCKIPETLPSNSLIQNGAKDSGDYSPGDVVTLGCEPDYTAEGCAYIMCQDTGVFTEPVLTCKAVAPTITCPPPVLPLNTQLSEALSASKPAPDGRYNIGNSVTFVCIDGASTTDGANSATQICQQNGTWAGCELQCNQSVTVQSCPIPTLPQNSRILPQPASDSGLYNPGDSTSLGCNDGFSSVGDAQITCQQNGTWSPITFACQAVEQTMCPEPQPPENSCTILAPASSEQGIYYPDDFVTFGCLEGFVPKGSSGQLTGTGTITCQETGVWTQTDFGCEVVVTTTTTTTTTTMAPLNCQTPTLPVYSTILKSGESATSSQGIYAEGDFVQYGCETDYTIYGTVQCASDGSWSSASMACQPVNTRSVLATGQDAGTAGTCPAPKAPTNAAPISSAPTYAPGEFVQYQCNNGYVSTGMLRCLRDGTWSASSFVCETGVAPSPVNQDNRNNVAPAPTGQCPTCNAAATSNNNNNNVFPPTNPTTQAPPNPANIYCQNPVTPQNAQIIAQLVRNGDDSQYPIGAFFVYKCDPGYFIEGDATILCNIDGLWTQPPRCVR